MSAPALAERYGTRAPWRRRGLLAAIAVVVLAGLGWLVWATWVHATPDVTSELVSFDVVDDHTAVGVLDVEVSDDVAGSPTCTVRAMAEDKSVVGQTTVSPEVAAGGSTREEVTVRTERLATTVESLGCTAAGQDRPR